MSPLLTLHSVGPVAKVTEFSLQYAGSVRVPSPQIGGKNLDHLLEKLRQTHQSCQGSIGGGGGEGGEGGEERNTGSCNSPPGSVGASLLVNKSYSSVDALADVDNSWMAAGDASVLDLLKDGAESGGDSSADCSLVKEEQGRKEEESDDSGSFETEKLEDNSPDVGIPPPPLQVLPTISVTPNSPTVNEAPADIPLNQRQDEPVSSMAPSTVLADHPPSSDGIRCQSVQLAINTERVCVTLPISGKVVLEKKITSIAFCIQVGLCVLVCVCVQTHFYSKLMVG